MKSMNNIKAFSLIELVIIIVIIGFLVIQAPTGPCPCGRLDAKKTKAKQDCDTLVEAIQKYNSLESIVVKNVYMTELKDKYVVGIENLRDPWGNRYEQDYIKGVVFSKEPDGRHDATKKLTEGFNKDDIMVPYIGALTIVDARLEVNKAGDNFNNTAGYDVLHLYFNKTVSIPVNGDLDLGSAATGKANSPTSDTSAVNFTFRYYDRADFNANSLSTGAGSPISDLKAASNIPPENSRYSMADFGDLSKISYACYAWGADSKEIVIKFAAGYTSADHKKKLLIPSLHYINLVGAKNNKNKTFYEFGGATISDGGEASVTQVLIKPYTQPKQ